MEESELQVKPDGITIKNIAENLQVVPNTKNATKVE